MAQKRVILQGQSRDGAVIRLKDKAPGFGDPRKPKAMVWTGRKPAQRFRNGIRNLTFDTGKGNAGAIGVQYIANNQGSVRMVKIVGEGPIGLDLGYTNEQGPCLIQDVTVEGFDVGVSMVHAVDSITMERVTVRGQKKAGISNKGQVVSIRGLRSVNTVAAVVNEGGSSVMTLLDSDLRVPPGGKSAAAAIENTGTLFARNVQTGNYAMAVRNGAGTKENAAGPNVAEFVSHKVLTMGGAKPTSLNLPIKETPVIPRDALADWVSPTEFGAVPDGKTDCTEAVQKAVDSGRKTLYFPYGNWRIDGTVEIRGDIQRVTALEGAISGSGTLKVVDGAAPAVTVERINLLYKQLSIEHASKRPVVVSGITFGKGELKYTGSGPLFIEDVCVHTIRMGERQAVYARQLNCEAKEKTKIINNGGTLWILGIKTEQIGTICETTDGGRTELCGFIYSNVNIPDGQPMFLVKDSDFSATIGESNFRGKPYPIVVEFVKAGKTSRLMREDANRRGGASILPLFVGRGK